MLEDVLQRRPYNAAADFVDANVARGLGDKIAFTDTQRSLTYAQLQARSCRFAAALKALDLRAENRVILLFHDTVDHPVAFWGAIRAGIIPIPVNTLLTAEQYAYLFADSRAAAAIVAAALAPTLLSLRHRLPLPALDHRGRRERRGKGRVAGRAVLRGRAGAGRSPRRSPRATMSDEVAFWMYTSGSTGDPKAVQHVHTSLMATRDAHGPGRHRHRARTTSCSRRRSCRSPTGWATPWRSRMSVGASAVLLPERPTPQAVLATHAPASPDHFLRGAVALRGAARASGDRARRRLATACGCASRPGEALPAHLGERWRAVVGVDILDGIGSTEMLQTFLSNRPGDVRYGSTGKPVPGYDVRIVDENGRELPHGEIGELVVRGPSAGEGYWNQRAKSRRTFAGEWTYTGDKYLRDADGYYYYCGRTDDMFKVNGMWVSPFEVEAALISHEAVLEAAVIGKEDGDGLIKPKAFIVLKNGYAADERLFETLRAHVKERAGPWKYPRWIDVRPDLPRTATGKIQRFKLRD